MGKKECTEFGNSQLSDSSLKCPFWVISRYATGQREVRFADERDILRGEQQPLADIPPFIHQLVGRARARTATRRGQAPSLLQVDGLIVPGLIELRSPHLVHALMLGFTEGHGRPEPNIEVAEIFEGFDQSFCVELRAISF